MAAGDAPPAPGVIGAKRISAASSLWAVALLSSLTVVSYASDTAREWLQRMGEASKTLNYEGTVVFRQGAHLNTMRIIHRADENGERERLISLNGVPREVLRDRARVTCILPDHHSVFVERRRSKGLLGGSFLSADEGLEAHYDLSVGGVDRVAGRTARVIKIDPRDEFRYGYRLWLDEETALLLKSLLLDEEGNPLEQFMFANMSLPQHIPDSLLEPEITGEGFTWYTNDGPQAGTVDMGASEWEAAVLPDGFTLDSSNEEPIPNRGAPVRHMVFTDGLASFSLYVERIDAGGEPFTGTTQMGAMNAYGRVVDDFQVTVVGEVPKVTVEKVGRAVKKK